MFGEEINLFCYALNKVEARIFIRKFFATSDSF